MPIVVIGLSHRSSPVTVRERFAFAETVIPDALQKIRDAGIAEEAVILSTCNRVEIYASSNLGDQQAAAALQQFLINHHQYGEPINGEITVWANRTVWSTFSESPPDSTPWCWARRKFWGN